MRLYRKASNSKSHKLQIQKPQRVWAFAVHPQCSASYCLGTADDSFLTSDPGIEGDAHTAVGVVGLHGNFPCATGAVTETEGGKGVSRTLTTNVQTYQFSIFRCVDVDPLPFFSTVILFAMHIVIHNIVIFTKLSVSLSDGSKISLTYLHQYNYTLLHCDYDSLHLSDWLLMKSPYLSSLSLLGFLFSHSARVGLQW